MGMKTMANKKTITLALANEVADLMRSLRKMAGTKAANTEYKSLSRVLKDMKELWTLSDGTAGYSEPLAVLGVTNPEWLTPKVLTECHPDLTELVEGKVVEVFHKPTNVYETNEDGSPKMQKTEKGGWVRVKKLDANGQPIQQLTTYVIKGWNPNTIIQYLAEDYKLRIEQFAAVCAKQNKKGSPEQNIAAAKKMYVDYVAAKFAPKPEPKPEVTEPKPRKPRSRK